VTFQATSIAARERSALTDLAERVGPDAPTLCEGWAVRDLVAHLVLRERSLLALGTVVRPLSGPMERERVRLAGGDFAALVERLRSGPPRLSPFGIPGLDKLLNSMEFFIHHEDVRRAQPGWEPRPLSDGTQDALWRTVRGAGRFAVSRVPVGVAAERPGSGDRLTLKRGDPAVVVRGEPAEVLLYVHGRRQHARVELLGPDQAQSALASARLGV
jgi:uncharacterized protein (TIGR03085 family)